MSAETLLEAAALTKRYSGLVALDDVSFRVGTGEVVGVIGPNGSGKTTLFDVLTGFSRPAAGVVRWRGRDVTRTSAHRRARLGLVRTFQQAMVFPALTVAQNAAMAVRVAASSRMEPADLVAYVQLEHVAATAAGDLSWGQTRLLGIALALAATPTVLLLDEPFAGLSPVAAEEIAAIIAKLRADGYSLAVIDHEMSYLLPICDRLVVLAAGRTIADGVPDEVIATDQVRSAYLGM